MTGREEPRKDIVKKDKEKKKRKIFDWEAIEKLYIAGMLSIKEIGRRHGCSDTAIRKKAKKLGWKRDLTEQVRRKVRDDLVRGEVREPKEQTELEEEVIEEAAKEGVKIIKGHRDIIQQCFKAALRFLNILEKDQLVIKINEDKSEVTVPIPNAQKGTLLNAATRTVSLMIPLERQAFNLDEEVPIPPGGGPSMTAYPSGPLSIAEWEKQINDKKRKKTDSGN